MNRSNTPVFNSSLTVFAEKVQQMQVAKRKYFALRKNGRKEEIDAALKDLQKSEGEVDILLHGILYKQPAKQLATQYHGN